MLIETRRAGDLLGATKMDRPEDVEANPKTNKVYVILTNNDAPQGRPGRRRQPARRQRVRPHHRDDAAGRRPRRHQVHLGDPGEVRRSVGRGGRRDASRRPPPRTAGSACRTTARSTREGRLWIATDGNSDRETGRTDGLWALETEGEGRATSKLFFRCPAGAELCGPEFTPDGETLFVAIQHPGDDGPKWKAFGRPVELRGSLDALARLQARACRRGRPSLAITKRGGGKIAS